MGMFAYEYKTAIKSLLTSISIDSTYASPWLNLGNVFVNQTLNTTYKKYNIFGEQIDSFNPDYYTQAITCYRKAIELDSSHDTRGTAMYSIGFIWKKNNNLN